MSSFLNRFSNHLYYKRPVATLFAIHCVVVFSLVILVKSILHLPYDFLLWDDGYYETGKNFYNGASLLHQYRNPGIPLLLSILNIFPGVIQPFLRLIITQFFTLLSIYFGFKIFTNILNPKAVVWGLIIALFNPLYLWWACIRSSPEVYLTTFLGAIIFFLMKLDNKWDLKSIMILTILIIVSLLFKPVLIFIPLAVGCLYFLHKKYKIGAKYFLVFIICAVPFKWMSDISKPPGDYSYGVKSFMVDPLLTQSVLDSGKFGYYIGGGPVSLHHSQGINLKVSDWIIKYREKNNNSYSTLQTCVDFIKDNPGVFVLSKILSPVYFISIADTTRKSLVNLIINSVVLIFAIQSIRILKKNHSEQVILILCVFLGHYFIYFLIQSCARYYIPISFYFSIFAGLSVTNLLSKNAITRKIFQLDAQ